jgi:two-component system sensor histidine kinase FlrB
MVAIESNMVVMRPQEPLVTVSARQRRVTLQPIDAEVLDALPTPLLVLDRHRVVERANTAALALLGEEVIGVYWDPSPAAQERPLRHGVLVSIAAPARATGLSEPGASQAALAHQIRNPLTVAGLSVEQLLLGECDVAMRERLERVRGSLQAIEQQIRNALVLVRGELSQRHTFTVKELVAAMRDAWTLLLDGHAVAWHETYGDLDCVTGDLATLVGALTNIVDNAVSIGGVDAALTVSIHCSGGALRITIADDGPGMDAALLARARQPFVSGRPGGTGLGLAIVDAVVQAHGGRFSLDSAPGAGTRAGVDLPLLGGAPL